MMLGATGGGGKAGGGRDPLRVPLLWRQSSATDRWQGIPPLPTDAKPALCVGQRGALEACAAEVSAATVPAASTVAAGRGRRGYE